VDKPGSSQLSDLPIWQAMESIRDYRHIYTFRMFQPRSGNSGVSNVSRYTVLPPSPGEGSKGAT